MNLHLPPRKILKLSLLLVVLGIVGIAPTIYYQTTDAGSINPGNIKQMSSAASKLPPVTVSGQPAEIIIPDLAIDLPVVNGYYNRAEGTWTLTSDKAQFATPSVIPNNARGNTLIYGHYRAEVFARLHLIKDGSLVQVKATNGYVFTYRYIGAYATNPTDTSIFEYQGAPLLTIQTCSGSWFQNRQMYQFAFVGFQKV